MRRLIAASIVTLAVATLAAQQVTRTRAPRLWTGEALSGWALPIAGVNATPSFYTEAEYYAAPVDELRTYPVYLKGREPKGYRDWIRRQGPQPLIEIGKARSDAEWVEAGRRMFDGFDLPENRTDDSRVLAWLDDPAAAEREHALVTKNGIIVSMRWIVDRDRKLKVTLAECSACHTRVLPDGTEVLGAQGNLTFPVSVFGFIFERAEEYLSRQGPRATDVERTYRSYAVPWLSDDVHERFKTMSKEDRERIDGPPTAPGTFPRFNGSPYFTNHMPDLIGVKDRQYLDATATHRNRGPEDIARYAILVTDADDGAIGPHRFKSAAERALHTRHSDDAMYALGKYIYALGPPKNPNPRNEKSARGEQIFTRSGCPSCHAPPLYTNNKLVAVEGFTPFEHAQAPPAADVMNVKLGLDPGLALRTRKGTGYYKVPSLKGLWYRTTLEHSGSIASLEEWFDPARLRPDYGSKGWNPPDVKTRAIPGHPFGLSLPADDKSALIAFLRTL
jgi:cytochrome c553